MYFAVARRAAPFFSDKYDITQHPNYKYLSDFDKKNAFDVERYMDRKQFQEKKMNLSPGPKEKLYIQKFISI